MVRWLAVGAVAANLLGSLVAVRTTVAGHDESLVVWLFMTGLLLAFVGAIVFDRMVRVSERPAVENERYWAQVEFGGKRDTRREAELQAKLERLGRAFLVPLALIGGSVAVFVVGVILLFVP